MHNILTLFQLARELTTREITQRYRGSILGILWSLLTPLCMLAVFTFVFAVVFRARWGASGETSIHQFAIIIFSGLTTFNLCAEVIGRAPTLITSQPNLVKKVVFPLEILPVVALGSALFQVAVALILLVAFQISVGTGFHWSVLTVPALILPLCLFTLGFAWVLAALGVYVRDINQIIPPILTAILFLSPIFYPSSALPDWIRPTVAYSPIAYSVEAVRDALIFGQMPGFLLWLLGLAGGFVVAVLGFAFFQKTRKGFADVL